MWVKNSLKLMQAKPECLNLVDTINSRLKVTVLS